jgi:uncharacterized coiled-coil protein SlyX
MDTSIDLIANQIAECAEQIEVCQRKICHLRQKIRELSWQVIEADEGEISHHDNVA